jgi:hypothetical protein
MYDRSRAAMVSKIIFAISRRRFSLFFVCGFALEEMPVKTLLVATLTLALAGTVTVPAAHALHRGSHRLHKSSRRTATPHRPRAVPPLNLAGRVLLPDGTPAAKANVTLSWLTQSGTVQFAKASVDAGANFRATTKLAGAARNCPVGITAFAAGQGSDCVQSTLGSKVLLNLTLRLKAGVALEGRLIGVNGSPTANTEVHVEALFPAAASGSPGSLQQTMLFLGRTSNVIPQPTPYDYFMRLLPDGAAPKLFSAHTDANGRFTLNGLPRRATVLLRTGGGFILTPASMMPLTLDTRARQDAGILVATKTGSAGIRVIDAITQKPASGVSATIMLASGVASGPVFYHGQMPFQVSTTVSTDPNGSAEVKDLLPGKYRVHVEGCVREIRVEEGNNVARADFTLRQGPLNGRLLDSNGKPLANVDILMNASAAASLGSSPMNGPGFNRISNFDGIRQPAGWERNPLARTGPDGSFFLPGFPWGAGQVIVRATRNNDRAEYRGPVSGIGSTLEMRMTPNALVSVRGRLVDPQRRVVSSMMCQALHWQNSPRPTWFASAHQVAADAHGRFRVDGLERGESFSIISSGQRIAVQQQAVVHPPSVKTVALTTHSPVSDFESPRFVANREGVAQDLGDVMVHPSGTTEEVLQSYGAARREVVSAGVIEAPDRPAVDQAQAALKRYYRALRGGDVRGAQSLTSRLSPDYSAQLPEFLMRAGLSFIGTSGGEDNEIRSPLRFVPRSLIQSLTSRNAVVTPFMNINNFSGAEGLQEISHSQDDFIVDGRLQSAQVDSGPELGTIGRGPRAGNAWVVLTANRDGNIALAGVLHFEDGQWRVVQSGMPPSPQVAGLAGFLEGTSALTTVDYKTKSSPVPMEQFVQAREEGRRFLRLWAENRQDAMRKETSQVSFSFAPDVQQYKKLQERRPDQGICPLNAETRVDLDPITNLTVWEEKWLASMAKSHTMTSQVFNGFDFRSSASSGVLSDKALKGGNLALLQYTAPTGRFLMALVRRNNQWMVLEPALPL